MKIKQDRIQKQSSLFLNLTKNYCKIKTKYQLYQQRNSKSTFMPSTIKRYSSDPNILRFSLQQTHTIINNQSRCSQMNPYQFINSPRKQPYYPKSTKLSQCQLKYEQPQKINHIYSSQPLQNYEFQTNSYYNQEKPNPSYYPQAMKPNVIHVKSSQMLSNPSYQTKKPIKTKLSRNIYLNKQNRSPYGQKIQQRTNYFLTSPNNSNQNLSKYYSPTAYEPKMFDQISELQFQFQNRNVKNSFSQNTSDLVEVKKIENYETTKKANKQNQRIEDLQFNNINGYTFKKLKQDESRIFYQERQNMQVETEQSYDFSRIQKKEYEFQKRQKEYFGLDFIQNISKLSHQSPRYSQKQSHLILELKSSMHNSTSDSRAILQSQEQIKVSNEIKKYQKQIFLLQNQNQQIEKQIQDQIKHQRQLMSKMKNLMKLFENLKNQQICNLKNNKPKLQKTKFNQLQIQSVCSQKSLRIPKPSNDFLPNGKKDVNQSTMASFMRTQQTNISDLHENKKQNSKIMIKDQFLDLSPKKLRINVVNDTILEYSPIDSSVLSPPKPVPLSHFYSGETLKDEIFEDDNFQGSKKGLVDVSTSGFESRFVPRQNNEMRLKQLQEIFQKQIKRCYSPNSYSQKSISENIKVERKQKKEKLKRLSSQIKQLRNLVEKQGSNTNLNMLLFSNTSLK